MAPTFSRLPGDPLNELYWEITPDVEQLLSAQLSRILAPLRAFTPTSGAVSSFDEGPVRYARSVAEFHEEVMRRTGGLNIPENLDAAAVHDDIRRAHALKHRVCLTHNDLGPDNILVDENWNITGIVDWEAAA